MFFFAFIHSINSACTNLLVTRNCQDFLNAITTIKYVKRFKGLGEWGSKHCNTQEFEERHDEEDWYIRNGKGEVRITIGYELIKRRLLDILSLVIIYTINEQNVTLRGDSRIFIQDVRSSELVEDNFSHPIMVWENIDKHILHLAYNTLGYSSVCRLRDIHQQEGNRIFKWNHAFYSCFYSLWEPEHPWGRDCLHNTSIQGTKFYVGHVTTR